MSGRRRPPAPESDGFRRTTITIPPDTAARFAAYCKPKHMTMSAFLTEAGEEFLRRRERTKGA